MTTQRSSTWSLTINNPTQDDMENINHARQKGWKVDGQEETGENGTKHYQMILKTPQIRFSAVKKAFPRAHIEIARNVVALQQYVQKEETRTGNLPIQSDRYPSLVKLWQLILDKLDTGDKNGLKLDVDGKLIHPIQFYHQCNQNIYVKEPLKILDTVGKQLIEEGYYVESILVNPATRSMWKLYSDSIMLRADKDRQTDNTRSGGGEDNQSIISNDSHNLHEKEISDSEIYS